MDESDVPLIVSELAGHWQSFNLRVRVDNLVGWLNYCDVCEEEYRVFVHAGLNYRGVRLVERGCFCGVERYSGWAARRGTGPRPTLEYVQVLAANVRGLWAADVFRFGGEIAGDRPPRYVPRDVFRLERTLKGDRPPHYENSGVSARDLRSVRP